MTAYAVWKSNVLYAHGITAMKSACKWREIFTVFSVAITSDYSYIFIENWISNMSYLFSYSRWHCTKSCCSWQVNDEGFWTVYASGLDNNRAGERNEATNLWRHHFMVTCICNCYLILSPPSLPPSPALPLFLPPYLHLSLPPSLSIPLYLPTSLSIFVSLLPSPYLSFPPLPPSLPLPPY